MVMDYLLISTLLFLFTFLSFNPVSSSASQPSYKDHCASIVPESTPNELWLDSFPLGPYHTGYSIGGDGIIDVGSSWSSSNFYLNTGSMRATQVPGLFKVVSTASIKRNSPFYYHVENISHAERSYYGHQRSHLRRFVTFKLHGFWSESSGKVCMIGTGSGLSKTGKTLHLDAVLKLNNVFNASNITTLVSGSLESLSSVDDENYFEPLSVLMLPKENYQYTLDSKEAENECSSVSDEEKGLSSNSLNFCQYGLSRVIGSLRLEYSGDCNSSKNCTPMSGTSGHLPSLVSLKGFECEQTEKKRLRVLVRFPDISYSEVFNPKSMLVGEGWWDEKTNRLCVVACHVMGMSSSLAGTHVGDCSVRLKLRSPSVWSINDTSRIVGQIWSSRTANDPGFFKMITFRNKDDTVGVQGLKYEYSRQDRVRRSCPIHKTAKNQGKRYPDPYSYNMRFDMSVRDFNRRVAWGYAVPISVGDRFYQLELPQASDSSTSSSIAVPRVNLTSSSLFNMSYRISISLMSNSTLDYRYSLFNMSSEGVKISAEGIYDAGAGTLCMVGCRDLPSDSVIPIAPSVDCEILVKFQFPPLDGNNGSYVKGSIESTRKISDPLYFKSLDLSSAAVYIEAATETVWRVDMEVIMVLISTTLACVFVVLQLYHVKRHPNVLPFMSLIMMSVLTLGHMIPLVLNFEALFAQNPNNKNFVFGNVGWLEVNEITVRLITMVAFLLQFRLLQLTWSARKTDGSNKGQWIAERKAACVTFPLYAAGLLVALLFKLKKDGEKVPMLNSVYQQHPSAWEDIKSYDGLVLDGFLLPQIMLNLFSNLRENVLSSSFYFGNTFVRLLPHAYDLYRTRNYAHQYNGSYFYADPSADFYSTAWDIVIPLGGILFAVIICLQQRFGAHCILPPRFKSSVVYEKLPAETEPDAEAEAETTSL